MIKPLNPLKYYKENKKKAAVVVVTLFFAVFCISLITTIVNSIFASAKDSSIAPLSRFTFVEPARGQTFLKQDAIDSIKAMDTVDSLHNVMISNTSITTVFGNTSAPIVFLDNDSDFNAVFEQCDLKLVDGRMPQPGAYEVILHSSMLKNKNLKVGDKFGDEVDSSEWVIGTYTIVGEFTGESVMGMGAKNYYLNSLQESGVDTDKTTMYALAFPKNGDIDKMNDVLGQIDSKTAFITSRDTVLKSLDEQMKSINSILSVIIVVVTLGMAVCVGALIMNFYGQRSNEFAILFAIGYNKKNIRRLICGELAFVSVLGWGIGYLASFGCFFFIDKWLFAPLGQKMVFFSASGLRYTLIVPLLVFLCAVIPVLRSLTKKDLVTVIERRG
ncbi:MAG: ABC transporter permease [Oscillospiraceae bacterium]